jgi:hypothetical protein
LYILSVQNLAFLSVMQQASSFVQGRRLIENLKRR